MENQSIDLLCSAIESYSRNVMVSFQTMIWEYERPSVIFRPKVFMDGNQWCALYGDNLQDGVSGFGNSPAEAVYDFDKSWSAKLKVEEPTP